MTVVGRKSQIDAWCLAHPRAAGVLKILRGVGFDPFLLVQGLALILFRRLPAGYQATAARVVPPPTDSTAPDDPGLLVGRVSDRFGTVVGTPTPPPASHQADPNQVAPRGT